MTLQEITVLILTLISELGAIALFIVKLSGVTSLSWGWVATSILWMPIILVVFFSIGAVIVAFLNAIIDVLFIGEK